MEVAHEVFRTEHYAYRTEETYTKWIKRFIRHFNNAHPREMGSIEIQQFLTLSIFSSPFVTAREIKIGIPSFRNR